MKKSARIIALVLCIALLASVFFPIFLSFVS